MDVLAHKLMRCESGPDAGSVALDRVGIVRSIADLCRAVGLTDLQWVASESALASAPEGEVVRAVGLLKYARDELLALRREDCANATRLGLLQGDARRNELRRLHSAAAGSGRSGLTGEQMLESQVLHRFVSPPSPFLYFACAQLTLVFCPFARCPLAPRS